MSYLNYKGYSNEIDVYKARTAGNFDIIRISKKDVPEPFFNRFVTIYEECVYLEEEIELVKRGN